MDSATPDQAHRVSQAGGQRATSMDRLVLSQLVTVLQATSALARGGSGAATSSGSGSRSQQPGASSSTAVRVAVALTLFGVSFAVITVRVANSSNVQRA